MEGDDGFGASDGEESTSLDGSDGGPETDSGSDDAGADDSSDESLELTDLRSMLNKRNMVQRYPSLMLSGGRGGQLLHSSEPDQTLEIMMSELVS